MPLAACAAQPAANAVPAQAAQAAQPVQGAVRMQATPQDAGGDAARQTAAGAAPKASGPAAAGSSAVGSTTAGSTAAGPGTSSAPAQDPPAAGSGMALPPAASPDTTVGGGAAARTVPAPAPVPVTMPSGSATGSLLQTLLALIVVLAVLGALAWFLKRYGPKAAGGSANLRIVGSLNLGGRERLLVVEVGSQWIVVGASPGRVNALATMPRQDGEAGSGGAVLSAHTPPANSFGDWLKQTIDKRK
jgi:flagellar protein FliO/FliZ